MYARWCKMFGSLIPVFYVILAVCSVLTHSWAPLLGGGTGIVLGCAVIFPAVRAVMRGQP
jgi:succinate-acetate transporter protein